MTGQINLNSQAGQTIYNICCLENVQTIVEIGTWNGHGSTKCIYQAIQNSQKKLYSFEIDSEKYQEAYNFYKDKPEINIYNGYISNKFIDLDSLDDKFFSDYPIEIKKKWYYEDYKNITSTKCLLDKVPKNIDFLILDGGEFNSFYEYESLKDRSTYIFCDDTNPPCIKNYLVRLDLIKNHEIIIDNPNERHGFCLAKKLIKQ
jgi:hypothetical protein